MMISSENKIILKLLCNWDSDIYNFYKIHDLELYDTFIQFNDIEMTVGCDLPDGIEDKFFQFGNTRDGGAYCLWFYPALEKEAEAPVIFAGMDGERCIIAPSFKEFACLLTQKKELDVSCCDYENDGTVSPWSDFSKSYNAKELGLNTGAMSKDIEKLSNQLSDIINCNNIVEGKDLPNFATWIDSISNT